VITAGATLEVCAQKLLKIDNVKVSLATIAIAENSFSSKLSGY
jgi:predicted amidophosphoribosyltransferase